METRMLRTLVLALVLIKACAGSTGAPSAVTTEPPAVTSPAAVTTPPGSSTPLAATTAPPAVTTATPAVTTATPAVTSTLPAVTTTPAVTTPPATTPAPTTTAPSPTATIPQTTTIAPTTTIATTTTVATTAATAAPTATSVPATATPDMTTEHTGPTTEVSDNTTPELPDQSTTEMPQQTTPEMHEESSTAEPHEDTTAPPEITSTTTTTTATPTTTPSNEKYPPVTPEPYYPLSLVIGVGTGITCDNFCTSNDLRAKLETSFQRIPGFVEVRVVNSANNRKKRQTAQISFVIFFNTQALLQSNSMERQTQIQLALNGLTGVTVTNETLSSISQKFSSVTGLCPTGYTLKGGVCQHDCSDYNCGDNGECRIHVSNTGTADVYCLCMSGYEYEYSGSKCEDSSTGKSKVVAIVAGVLGTLCGILIIVLIWMCYRQGVFGGSDSKYQIGGQTNPTYSDIDMQKM